MSVLWVAFAGKILIASSGFAIVGIAQIPLHEYGHCVSHWMSNGESECVVTYQGWADAEARVPPINYDHILLYVFHAGVLLAYWFWAGAWLLRPFRQPRRAAAEQVVYVPGSGSVWDEQAGRPRV